MKREIRHSSASHGDYAVLIEYLVEERGIEVARAVDAKLEASLASLRILAGRGRLVPVLRRETPGREYREILCGSYRIVYLIEETEVWIVAIVDRHRHVDELLLERAARFRARGQR